MKYKLDEELKQVLISNIIFFREKLGISQYALAKMIGVTQPYMAQMWVFIKNTKDYTLKNQP